MSWVIETALRVTIDNDPKLVGAFMNWLQDTEGIEAHYAVIDMNHATFEIHRDHEVAVRNALIDLGPNASERAVDGP